MQVWKRKTQIGAGFASMPGDPVFSTRAWWVKLSGILFGWKWVKCNTKEEGLT